MNDTYTLMLGDCLDFMQRIPAGSVDLVLTDPPCGTDGEDPGCNEGRFYWECYDGIDTDGDYFIDGDNPYTSLVMITPLEVHGMTTYYGLGNSLPHLLTIHSGNTPHLLMW